MLSCCCLYHQPIIRQYVQHVEGAYSAYLYLVPVVIQPPHAPKGKKNQILCREKNKKLASCSILLYLFIMCVFVAHPVWYQVPNKKQVDRKTSLLFSEDRPHLSFLSSSTLKPSTFNTLHSTVPVVVKINQQLQSSRMKIAASIVTAFIAGTISTNAFVAPHQRSTLAFQKGSSVISSSSTSSSLKSMSDELDIPCEDDCALESYPNLPATVHPGVNTGQAMIDLLMHAKQNGESKTMSMNH